MSSSEQTWQKLFTLSVVGLPSEAHSYFWSPGWDYDVGLIKDQFSGFGGVWGEGVAGCSGRGKWGCSSLWS